jgi:hypothetical protein
MLDAFPWGAAQAQGLRERGRLLFGIGARLLKSSAEEAEEAGELWSLHDAAVHCSDARSRVLLENAAKETAGRLPRKLSSRLRPMTVIAALAAADLVSGGRSRGRAALAHRLFGSFPR